MSQLTAPQSLRYMSATKFVVMRVHSFEKSLKGVDGTKLIIKDGETPREFLPVFDSKEAAIKFNGGKDEAILEVEEA